jgi:hypothetical protein
MYTPTKHNTQKTNPLYLDQSMINMIMNAQNASSTTGLGQQLFNLFVLGLPCKSQNVMMIHDHNLQKS